ncbi:MAG: HAMP domain-containing histidine kinase [Polyangiaceae bacterium]|jgi:signal transduction histidine kinase|nr:HAMP domain-containing histidine kinase [Polyangiaceae bacterium]
MTAAQLVSYVLALQVLVVLAIFGAQGLGAPWLLLLDGEQSRFVLRQAMAMAVVSELLALGLIWRRLGRVRYTLRALALGSRAFEPDELVELAAVPAYVVQTTVGLILGTAFVTLLPFARAGGIDLAVGIELLLLLLLLSAGAGLPLFALMRGAVARALEQAPPDLAGEALILLERDGVPRRRTLVHMVAAVVIPLSLVAVGAALVAHARVRAAANEARADTAIALARALGEDLPGVIPDAGRAEALRRAREEQRQIRFRNAHASYSVQHEEDGSLLVTVPLQEGHALVATPGGSGTSVLPWALLSSLLLLILALWVGWRLGHTLASDLVEAARQVRSLGNERVLQGVTPLQRPPWFRTVAGLGQALSRLAERFRIFAAAQERAIEAREAALRLRGLLFASVSHDLKSPLNAVLGFSALAASEPLNDAQQESLAIIERRGRELLALIETILDAARVEAQQLTLSRASCSVHAVVEQALRKAADLAPLGASPVEVIIDPGMPAVYWDDARVAQALAALLGHAQRLSPGGGVRLEAEPEGGAVVLRVREPSGKFRATEVALLLDGANSAMAPRRLGGLALGLGLARSLIQLHGGSLDAQEAAEGGVLFRMRLAAALTPDRQAAAAARRDRRGPADPC